MVISGNLNAIRNHLRRYHSGLGALPLVQSDIIRTLSEMNVHDDMPKQPGAPVQAISGISPPVDGFQCRNCGHAIVSSDGPRHHTQKLPSHVMHGGLVQLVKNVYWKVLPAEAIRDISRNNLTAEHLDMIQEQVHWLLNPDAAPEVKANQDEFVH